ncbi:MAG: arginase family protein [Myxococcota bacterium]
MTDADSDDSAPEVRINDTGPTMFNLPRWQPDAEYDVVFIGVPSDAGGLGNRSPAAAPSFLRTASALFPTPVSEGRCQGFYDYTVGQPLLAGARMADAGDLVCDRGAGMAQFEALPAVYATLRETCAQLVILGGDHSLSYFLAHSLDGEGIVWLDAHEDAGPRHDRYPHCANVVSYIDELANIPVIAQYGLRGIVPLRRDTPPDKRVLCHTSEQVVDALRTRDIRSTVLTVDVDVIDPSILPAVGSPMPEGMSPTDLLALLDALLDADIAIPVLELAEFAPISDQDITSGLVLVNFLLRALHRCHAARTRAQGSGSQER